MVLLAITQNLAGIQGCCSPVGWYEYSVSKYLSAVREVEASKDVLVPDTERHSEIG